ncbi:MAG: hypothetical protein HY692_06650 [Cyanobacteria bacterium NC_groundwater_1444_Ag_S-0.65um_54_12]|nr:hypothetical protein [Cyanobacteria bacterium NC_groundwater_1444_Ag_S-0.65um_54_12]
MTPFAFARTYTTAEKPPVVIPFRDTPPATKAGALYGMHTYWSKKPHDTIRAFIRHYSRPGALVLDPFCGSGGTALAALLEGRVAIALDRSPAAVFIARHYCQRAETERVRAAAQILWRQLALPASDLYATDCDGCGQRARLLVTLFDHGEPRGTPHPVELRYECLGSCRPRSRRRPANERDRHSLAELSAAPVGAPYPRNRMMNEPAKRWGDNWRAGTASFTRVDQLFTPRNLRAMAILQREILALADPHARDVLLFTFSAHLFAATSMQQVRSGGGGYAKGTYYVPRKFLERNAFVGFARRLNAVLAGKQQLPDPLPPCCHALANATALPLPDSCIDYLFTDPPYGGAIQYGELNFLWESWLGMDTEWHAEEIVINRTRGLEQADWERGMRAALHECQRVLKHDGYLSLCFQATDATLWAAIQGIMAETGFELMQLTTIEPAQQSYNRLRRSKTVRRDLVITWKKVLPVKVSRKLVTPTADESHLCSIVQKFLRDHPDSPKDRIHDHLVSTLIRSGQPCNFRLENILAAAATPTPDGGYLARE